MMAAGRYTTHVIGERRLLKGAVYEWGYSEEHRRYGWILIK